MSETLTTSSCAAVFAAPDKPLELQHFSLPALQTGEVLIRVSCCTLCGSDIHTFTGHRSTPSPTILGHEILGNVAAFAACEQALDADGQLLNIGDRVTWSVAASCKECFFCTHGLPQKCEHLFKYGHERITVEHPLSGGLAEYCHLAAGTAIFRVPEALPDVVAASANCATATVAAAIRTAAIEADETVLIQGAGMLGITAAAMCAERGAKNIVVTDINPERLELAKAFGATHTVLASEDAGELDTLVRKLTDGRGVDAAIELAGSSVAMQMAVPMLRTGGRYVLVGAVFPVPSLAIAPEIMIRRLLSIHGIHNYAPGDLKEALRFLAANHERYPFASLVEKSFPLGEIADAFAYAIEKRPLRVAVAMVRS